MNLQEEYLNVQAKLKLKIDIIERMGESYQREMDNLIQINKQIYEDATNFERMYKLAEKEKEVFEERFNHFKLQFENEYKEKTFYFNNFKELINKLNSISRDNKFSKSQNVNYLDKMKYFFESVIEINETIPSKDPSDKKDKK